MPRLNLILGLLLFCTGTPWIVADSVENENATVRSESTTETPYVDDTRRDPRVFSIDHNNKPTIENEIGDKNETQSLVTTPFDQPTEELTGFETEVPCDNAQFLLKILTVMLPLLRDEVPASTRTSYILHVLRALLKSSPEAAQDYEVMYKINDLLVTLEKYHGKDKYDLNVSNNALRQRVTGETIPSGVKSKVVFKYEVPQLTNPDCTAELLTITKTVQQAILRLVNNPLCKSHVPVEMPILLDVNKYFKNPKLYSYDNKKPIDDSSLLFDADKSKLLPEQHQILDIDIPEEITDKNPFYSYIPEHTVNEENPNYYDKLPFQQEHKQHLYPEMPKNEQFYNYPEYPDGKKVISSPYSYDVSPDIFSIINGGLVKPEYSPLDVEQLNPPPYINDQPYSSTPSVLDIKLPTFEQEIVPTLDVTDGDVQINPHNNPYDFLPKDGDAPLRPKKQSKKRPPIYENDKYYPNDLDTISPQNRHSYEDIHNYNIDNPSSGEFQIDKHKPYSLYAEKHSPEHSYELDLQSLSSPQSLDIYGDVDSADAQIGSYKPNQQLKKPKPSRFNVDGSPYSAYISLDQNPHSPDLYIHPKQHFNKNPNKYDTSPQNLPTERGLLDRPKTPFNPYSPNDSSNRGPNNPAPYNSYLPNPHYKPPTKPFTPFDVSGNDSGEIQLGSTELPIKDYIEFDLAKTKHKYPHPLYRPPFTPFDKDNPETVPEYYWPKDGGNEDLDNVKPEISRPIDLYTTDQETKLISEPITHFPSRPDAENQYVVIPEIKEPYEDVSDSEDLSPEFDIPGNNEPEYWNPSNIHTNISPKPQLVDNKILLIIKDNIDVIKRKIPKEHLNTEIGEMIRRLTDLLDLKQITIEEYVNIINQYQMLLEYIKHLDISNAIMTELLLSITNLDKLDLLTGNSQFIELTYLIKRPKPLIYQPYYYIKYQLPYESFLTKVERLLAVEPQLKKNPAKLYKALISISNVAETSPDLEKYGKEDIFRLAFNKGTLVGAKVVKETDVEMYNTLDKLKDINSDFTVEDVYELITNLDSQLKHTSEGLVFEKSNIRTLNTYEQPDEIRIMKVKNQPIIQKVTKITTNKIAADDILADIINRVNVLKSNMSVNYPEEGSNLTVESNTEKTNGSSSLVGRTRDTYDLDQFNNGIPLDGYEAINYNTKSNAKTRLPDDLNYYTKNNAEKYQAEGLSTTKNEFDKKSKNYNSKVADFDSIHLSNLYLADDSTIIDSERPSNQQLHSNTAKFLDTSLKDNTIYKHDGYTSQQHFESAPASLATSEIVSNLNKVKSHLIKHSKTYINGVPVRHSKSYLVEKPYNEVHNYETAYKNPVKYNMENSQSFIDYNPYLANNNYYNNPSQPQDMNLEKEPQASNIDSSNFDAVNNLQTFIKENSNTGDNNSANKNESQGKYLVHYHSYNNANNFAQTPGYLGGNPYNINNQHINMASNLKNLGLYNQNLAANNNMMNTGSEYYTHQSWPYLHQLNRRPRVLTRPFYG